MVPDVSHAGTDLNGCMHSTVSMVKPTRQRKSSVAQKGKMDFRSRPFSTSASTGSRRGRRGVSAVLVTVAHCLRAIIGYDGVLVLDDGKIVEFDEPKILLDKVVRLGKCAAPARTGPFCRANVICRHIKSSQSH